MISRKREPSSIILFFGGCELTTKSELDILGVTFDSKLVWAKHISSVSKKAGQRLGAMRKVASKLDMKGRATIYKAQVRSIMEYACLSWMSASQTVLSQLDSIQRKALRIIGVNVADAAEKLAIDSLHHRRQVAATTVLYKMHTSHSPADLRAMLPSKYVRRRNTRSSTSMPTHALSMPAAKTSTLDRSFLHSAVRIWNSLPDAAVGTISVKGIQNFKCQVHQHLLLVPP